MTRPKPEALREMSREDLIALILSLIERVQQLEAEVAALKAKTPPTSSNSSLPPSRDWKADAPTGKKRRPRRPGAKPGHAKCERALVDQPNQVIEAPVKTCSGCGADLQAVKPERIVRRQVTELPELKPVVLETRQHEVVCPHCRSRQCGSLPEGLEAQRHFGPRLEALITYLHHEHHLSFQRLQSVLEHVLGLRLSEGGEVSVLERAGAAAQPEAETIGERVRESAVIQSDETSSRVHGRNWWEWVFVSAAGEYHLIRNSRGLDVIQAFMGKRKVEVWVSDCWPAQLKAPAQVWQVCLTHQIRNLQGLIDRQPRLRWAREMQALFRAAIHLGNRRAELTARGYQRQIALLERRLDRLLARPVSSHRARILRQRYRTHRQHLFVFLHRTDVPADNNASERALRPSVIHRKVMGSFRSDWGAHAYAALATVINTAKRAGENIFQKLVSLMGKPVLHYLQPSIA